MMKANKVLAVVLAGAAFSAVGAADPTYNQYTKTKTGNIADVTLTANETIITDKLSEEGVDTLRFTRSSNFYNVKLRSAGGNDLPGGIIANAYNLIIQNPNVLGTGPLLLTNDWSSLQVDWGSCDVLNRVVFGANWSFAVGQGPYLLTLHNIGIGVKNSTKRVLLGRDGYSSSVCLALDGEENDSVGYFCLRDRLALTLDGGTLWATADVVARDLFQRMEATENAPTVTIANRPLTIETSGGREVRFGVTPAFVLSHTNEVFQEEYKTDDWSFESGVGEWTVVQGRYAGSGVFPNGSSYDTRDGIAWTTTNGSKYVMLRLGAQVYRNFNVPTAGKWKVVFERGCRPDYAYSMNMTTTVYVDDVAVCTFPALTKTEEKHPFKEFSTDIIDLVQGTHKIAIGVDGTKTDEYASLNFDVIRLQRYEVEVPPHAIAKTGEGVFVLNDVNKGDLTVTTEAGMLACENVILPNAAISVANGAEFDAAGLSAAGATIDVAAGGKISFRSVDLIVNGSFETPVTSNYGWYWASECNWDLAPRVDPRPGIQLNGGTYTPTYNKTPYGTQMLFLRSANSASQTITVPKDGTYELSYWACARKNYPSLTMTVTIDDTAVVTGQTLGADEYVRTTKKVALAKGDHTLKFETAAGGHQYALMFIDNVSLADATVQPSDLSETTLQLKSGSIVRLDNTEKVVVGSATVDGVEVNGGAATLRRAGVIVEGSGQIQCGTPRGLILLVR